MIDSPDFLACRVSYLAASYSAGDALKLRRIEFMTGARNEANHASIRNSRCDEAIAYDARFSCAVTEHKNHFQLALASIH